MANHYAKLVGFFPVHAFTSKVDRADWMKSSKSVTEAIDAKEARECAKRDGWMICHFPAKPTPSWDTDTHVWYRALEGTDGRIGEYGNDEPVEWRCYEI